MTAAKAARIGGAGDRELAPIRWDRPRPSSSNGLSGSVVAVPGAPQIVPVRLGGQNGYFVYVSGGATSVAAAAAASAAAAIASANAAAVGVGLGLGSNAESPRDTTRLD